MKCGVQLTVILLFQHQKYHFGSLQVIWLHDAEHLQIGIDKVKLLHEIILELLPIEQIVHFIDQQTIIIEHYNLFIILIIEE
jgi:hypothetical protein